MVASTTSANPTITGECVAELECGFSREAPKNCLHDGLRKSDLTSVPHVVFFFQFTSLAHLLIMHLQVKIILD